MKNLISVIVAVYNTAPYLPRCIDSVLAQTYQDWELILIDDGSTDESGKICDLYANNDSRISVLHQENRGVAAVRNTGVLHAAGKYITFLDSDDLLACDALQRMLVVALQTNADCVECDYLRFANDSEILHIAKKQYTTTPVFQIYTPESFLGLLIEEKKMHQLVPGKLMKRCCFSVPFPEGKFVEDEYWTFQMVSSISSIATLEEPMYLYYFRENSFMNSRFSERRLHGVLALKERHAHVLQEYPNLEKLSARSYFGSCMYLYQMILAHTDVDPQKTWRKMMIKEMRALPFSLWKKELPIKQRFWQASFLRFPNLIGFVRNLFHIGW